MSAEGHGQVQKGMDKCRRVWISAERHGQKQEVMESHLEFNVNTQFIK